MIPAARHDWTPADYRRHAETNARNAGRPELPRQQRQQYGRIRDECLAELARADELGAAWVNPLPAPADPTTTLRPDLAGREIAVTHLERRHLVRLDDDGRADRVQVEKGLGPRAHWCTLWPGRRTTPHSRTVAPVIARALETPAAPVGKEQA